MSPSTVDAVLPRPEIGTVPGWFHHGSKILELVAAQKSLVCVEIGTWLGASAIPVALSIRRWGGTLTCVDTWSGDIYRSSGEPPWMLTTCARNMHQAGVSSHIRLIAAPSLDAAQAWSGPIDYLYIDADHHHDAVIADLCAWVPHVRTGGLIVGDDYGNRSFPGVQQAWDEFEQASGLTFTRYQSSPPHPDGVQLIHGIKDS